MTGLDVSEKPRRVGRMFSRIAARYDLMNTLMTGGQDKSWRRLAVQLTAPQGIVALDIGTGTAELSLELLRQKARAVVGLDISQEMLLAAQDKARRLVPQHAPHFLSGDALSLPFPDATFDAVISGFVVRNLADILRGFQEMHRVIRPGGRLVCLEITHPRPGLFAHLFRVYFYRFVPLLGGIVAGDPDAYRYLPHSLTTFPPADGLAELLREAGFGEVGYRRLFPGTVAVHYGKRS